MPAGANLTWGVAAIGQFEQIVCCISLPLYFHFSYKSKEQALPYRCLRFRFKHYIQFLYMLAVNTALWLIPESNVSECLSKAPGLACGADTQSKAWLRV